MTKDMQKVTTRLVNFHPLVFSSFLYYRMQSNQVGQQACRLGMMIDCKMVSGDSLSVIQEETIIQGGKKEKFSWKGGLEKLRQRFHLLLPRPKLIQFPIFIPALCPGSPLSKPHYAIGVYMKVSSVEFTIG
ncbi:hypothetical protein TrispH2_004325 [Trichoplax sp. H2]|nr:hypothetical protein TrispH2_004325 [Trichoplax sp. H2]|eukprot:RDD44524.1 hypothetical protein TrispH2_004325 [Trichoplax sp. H2]